MLKALGQENKILLYIRARNKQDRQIHFLENS